MDTHISDPPCRSLYVDHALNRVRTIGNIDAREGSGLTWKGVLEMMMIPGEGIYRSYYESGERIGVDEQGIGCKVSLSLFAAGEMFALRYLAIPQDLDWELNGKAPWENAIEVEVDPTTGAVISVV